MHIAVAIVVLVCEIVFVVGSLLVITILIRDMIIASAPFVPIRKTALDEIMKALALTPESRLYDLGSGDARVLLHASESCPGVHAVGIEIGLLPRLCAKARIFLSKQHAHISIRNEDLFTVDISDATHLFMYLFPDAIRKLETKCANELPQGARVVICDFPFPTRVPTEVIDIGTGHLLGKKLFVYTF